MTKTDFKNTYEAFMHLLVPEHDRNQVPSRKFRQPD